MNTTKITKRTTLAILAIAAVGMIVSSTAIVNPALAKKQAQRCIDNHLG
jgi:hypothetical protein